jgi:hypothetical protein
LLSKSKKRKVSFKNEAYLGVVFLFLACANVYNWSQKASSLSPVSQTKNGTRFIASVATDSKTLELAVPFDHSLKIDCRPKQNLQTQKQQVRFIMSDCEKEMHLRPEIVNLSNRYQATLFTTENKEGALTTDYVPLNKSNNQFVVRYVDQKNGTQEYFFQIQRY